ncbi:hypothetical protein MNBD_IGNAVI01-1473 [hydrothermal vent metagenome]|uniref:YCII-related domain-containing protein n=1 Tax=hydrothermal vent metagenome TaxID=652676 RepID=A0A3B1D0D9_9ZZZZ
MQFIVIAHDAKDEGALERRLSVREQHLEFAAKMFESGKWLFASALLNDNDKMNGSVIACEFPSEEELRKEWLDKEAYILGNVWENVIIRKAKFAKH